MKLELVTEGEKETLAVGDCLGRELLPGDLVALTGELGAGKTCFVKGLSRGLQVPAESYVRSPSFLILNIYDGRCPLYHMDLYRIHDPSELEDLGYRDFFFGEGVTAVEWAEKIPDLLPMDRVNICFSFLGETRRELKLEAKGDRFSGRWNLWKESLSPYL